MSKKQLVATDMNSNKIINLTNGSAASDAAAFGQIPTAGTTPSTQAFGDTAAGGSATTFSKNDHKHTMMAAPTLSGLGGVTLADALSAVYPVGCIYTSTASTNPATVFGFGTWAAFGAGQVLVGKAASGTFSTAGATGGAETVTLTTTQMPSHQHQVGVDGAWDLNQQLGGGSFTGLVYSNGGDQIASTNLRNYVARFTGGGGSHNNLQPYIVVYLWNRTA